MRWILTTLAGLLATSSVQAAPYEAAWAPRERLCYALGSDVNIDIRGRTLMGYEHRCRFTRVRRTGSKYVLDMSCQGDGGPFKDQMTIEILSPDRISARGKSWGKNPSRILIRCPAGPTEQKAVRGLTELWHKTQAACRGTDGKEACEELEYLQRDLGRYDWCYGRQGEPEDQWRLHECGPQSIRKRY